MAPLARIRGKLRAGTFIWWEESSLIDIISIKINCMEKNNQYALVTGASSGIGYELAKLEAKNVKEGELADAAKVAKDGYEALMSGKDMVVSGFKNKMTVAMSNMLSDEKVAEQVKKQQSPAEHPAD